MAFTEDVSDLKALSEEGPLVKCRVGGGVV
jgi:hypothetical protein